MNLTRSAASAFLTALLVMTPSAYADFGYALASMDVENFNVTQSGGTGTLTNFNLFSHSNTNLAGVDSQKVTNTVAAYNLPQSFAGDTSPPPP